MRKSKRGKTKRAPARKISSARPAARDEGPRLIPLPAARRRDEVAGRHLELADIALGLTPPSPKPKRKKA